MDMLLLQTTDTKWWPIESRHCWWPWVTLKVIHLLRAVFECDFCTAVQQWRFQLHSASRGPSATVTFC